MQQIEVLRFAPTGERWQNPSMEPKEPGQKSQDIAPKEPGQENQDIAPKEPGQANKTERSDEHRSSTKGTDSVTTPPRKRREGEVLGLGRKAGRRRSGENKARTGKPDASKRRRKEEQRTGQSTFSQYLVGITPAKALRQRTGGGAQGYTVVTQIRDQY